METRKFLATIEILHSMLQWIRSEADKMAFESLDRYKIELAAEEAIVNVIRHSYAGKEGEVSITIDSEGGLLKITISDSGQPFNPLAKKSKAGLYASLEERQMGGLGLVFIRKCLDEVSYQRKNNQNILTLIKKIPSY
jgi:anti-sigma regulatory factor (Ser/Thr protein kinase)